MSESQDPNPPSNIKLSDIEHGRIRQHELQPELLKQLEEIYRDATHYIDDTLEQFERSFMCDMYPELEAVRWRRIADAFLLYCQRHANGRQLAHDEGEALVNALVGISMGVNVRKLKVSEDIGHRLVACWRIVNDPNSTPITVRRTAR